MKSYFTLKQTQSLIDSFQSSKDNLNKKTRSLSFDKRSLFLKSYCLQNKDILLNLTYFLTLN